MKNVHLQDQADSAVRDLARTVAAMEITKISKGIPTSRRHDAMQWACINLAAVSELKLRKLGYSQKSITSLVDRINEAIESWEPTP